MYYTDTGSTLFILLTYYYQLKSNHQLSALCGGVAILYRQTNVVWVGFCMCQLILQNIEALFKVNDKKLMSKEKIDSSTLNAITQQRNKKYSNTFELLAKTPNEVDFDLVKFCTKFYREDIWGKKLIYPDLLKVVDMNLIRPYTIVLVTFLFFVLVNNGIVVGDRSNHQASFHLTQMFYFWSFSCFFTASSFLLNYKKIKNLFSFIIANGKVILVVVLPLFCVIVGNFSYEHPFLLSDNRHYAFYIWSKLMRRHELFKFALTPIYLACFYLFYRNLSLTGKSVGWLLCFSLCLLAGLVPQQLIEFRYFIIPFYIYRLNINQFSWKEVFAELVLNSALNILTIYVFLNKTFLWSDSQELQRFMW